MGKLYIKVKKDSLQKSIPVKQAVRILNAYHDLYLKLAENSIKFENLEDQEEETENKNEQKQETEKVDLKDYDLEFASLHFSDAEFILQNPAVQTRLDGVDNYAKPIEKMIYISKLLEEGGNKSVETFKKLKLLIPDKELRTDILETLINVNPSKNEGIIEFKYSSNILSYELSYPNMNHSYKSIVRSWKQLNQSESIIEKTVFGVLKGIVTITEQEYLLIETEDGEIVKCIYDPDTLPPHFSISNLRVKEDIIIIKGDYLTMEGRAKDQLINIKNIQKVESDIDYDDEKEIDSLLKLNEDKNDSEV